MVLLEPHVELASGWSWAPIDRCHAPIRASKTDYRLDAAVTTPIELPPVDRDLNLIGIVAVAHPVAALHVHDVHVEPRRLVDFAGKADDHPWSRLADGRHARQREHHLLP